MMTRIKRLYRWVSCGVSPKQFWLGVSVLAAYGVAKAFAIEALDPGFAAPVIFGLGDLFGTKKGATTTVQNSEPWMGVQPHLRSLFSNASGLYNQGKNSGSILAPLSSETQQAQSILGNRALTGSPLIGAAQNFGLNVLQGDYLDPYQNPHFKSALDQTLGDVRSSINSQFKGSNYGTSAHQEWLGRGLMGAAAPALSQAFQANQDRQYGILGNAGALANLDYGDIGMLQSLGAQKDTRAQAELDAPWMNLQRYQQGVFPAAGIGGQSTNQTPYYQNNTANTLGTLGSAAMAYLFLSDRKAKKDIEKVGERSDGIGIYEFRYKSDSDKAPKRIGFMADDVAKVKPEAVGERDGMQWVDYGALVK